MTVVHAVTRSALFLAPLAAACCPGPTDVVSEGDARDAVEETEIGEVDAIEAIGPIPPAPPEMECPSGWREVPGDDQHAAACDPWPEGGREECAAEEAHFLGEPGCSRIGTACPDGPWAEDARAAPSVRFVLKDAPPGGTGSEAAPFPSIAEAMAGASAGTVIAVSKGTFDGEVTLAPGVTLWGACVAETVLTASTPSDGAGVVNARGRGGVLRNLQITGPRAAIWVEASRTIQLEDVLVANCAFLGLAVPGGRLTGENVIVRDTRGSLVRSGLYGRGLAVQNGGHAELTRSVFERNHYGGIAVSGGSSAVFTDLVIWDTAEQESDDQFGRGLSLYNGGDVTVTRAAVERSREIGVAVEGATGVATSMTVDWIVVRDGIGEAGSRGLYGRGITVQAGATVNVTHGLFEGNREAAAFAAGEGTVLNLDDVVIRGTRGNARDGEFGRAVEALRGAHAEMTRGILEGNAEVAVDASLGASVGLTDVVIRDTRSQESDSHFGRGMNVQYESVATLTRVIFDGNRDVSLFVGGPGTTATLEDVVVRNTAQRACVSTSCPGAGAGIGLAAIAEGSATVRRFEISDNAMCGIQLAPNADVSEIGGTVDLHYGVVSGNPIGANVQTDGFPLSRLDDHVSWRDNGRDIDMSRLPPPESTHGLP